MTVLRLISRLRYRQFGILVTISAVSTWAHKEIREDKYPLIVLCGRDIAELLVSKRLNSREAVVARLRSIGP